MTFKRFRQRQGRFFLSLLLNAIFNLRWTVPAWVLLALHHWLGWPVWLARWAFLIWLAAIVLITLVFRFLIRYDVAQTPPENKNPYSVGADSNTSPNHKA